MTAELADLSQCPNRAERALALAVGYGEQDQGAQALDALEQALNWAFDRQQLSQHLLIGAFGDLSRAMALHAPANHQPVTRQRQALDSLAIIRRSLATDPATHARHRTAGCRTATGAPKARTIVPEPSASQPALFHCRAQQAMARALNPYGDGLAAARIRDALLQRTATC